MLAQVGTTIGMGLLVDTLVIRSFMTPSIAALLGRWFWWPQRVRQRPVPSPWPEPTTEETEPVPAPARNGKRWARPQLSWVRRRS